MHPETFNCDLENILMMTAVQARLPSRTREQVLVEARVFILFVLGTNTVTVIFFPVLSYMKGYIYAQMCGVSVFIFHLIWVGITSSVIYGLATPLFWKMGKLIKEPPPLQTNYINEINNIMKMCFMLIFFSFITLRVIEMVFSGSAYMRLRNVKRMALTEREAGSVIMEAATCVSEDVPPPNVDYWEWKEKRGYWARKRRGR